MTEEDWLKGPMPEVMLEFLRGKVSDRKLRLFSVACCRRLETDIPDQKSWDAVHTAEAFADGVETEHDLEIARKDAEDSQHYGCPAALHATSRDAWEGAFQLVSLIFWLGWEADEEGDEMRRQVKLLHDIFGPLPFRPVEFAPSWLTPTVVKLAQAIYDDRSYDRLPILGDALEETGCDVAEVLAHCRGLSPHVRGCWVLDLVLGKE